MRKRKSGQRYANGRLKGPTTRAARKAYDYGNDVVQKRRLLFDAMCIKNGKAADQVHDGIGQLWALDFLDGHGHADDTLRDAGRLFAELWWERYEATAPKTSKLERASRTTNFWEGRTRRDIMFDRMDDSLRPGYLERAAVMTLCVDPWFRDHIAPWANRLIQEELLKRGRHLDEVIELPTQQDRDMLTGLIRALNILVDGSLPARFEQRRAA